MAPLGEAGGAKAVRADLGVRVEARLEVGDVHRLRVGAERLEGHRHLLRRALELSRPHVDGVLPALIANAPLGTSSCARALVPATCGLALARSLAAAKALARVARARLGAKRVETNLFWV